MKFIFLPFSTKFRIQDIYVFPLFPVRFLLSKSHNISPIGKESLYHRSIGKMIYLLDRMQDDRFLETAFLLASNFHQQLCLQAVPSRPD